MISRFSNSEAYPHEQWESFSEKSNPEVFRLRSDLGQNILKEFSFGCQNVAQLVVVIKFRLVKIGEFLAQWNSFFPALSLVEIATNKQVG